MPAPEALAAADGSRRESRSPPSPCGGPEAAILLGATIQYQISEVADRNVGVVASVRKHFLPPVEPKKP
jgi:hypothetical protein